MFTIKEDWNRQKLVDTGYASESTARLMMMYQVQAPESKALDPTQDKLLFKDAKLYCGVCLTQAGTMPPGTPQPEPIALGEFTLRFKGPLSAEAKHLQKCSVCGSLIQICGGALETGTGNEPIVTVMHETSPQTYTSRPGFQLPRLIAQQIELA